MTIVKTTLSGKAVLATLTLASWGVRKHDEEATEETLTRKGASKQAGLFTKRLLNKHAMKEIRKLKHQARKLHRRRTSPWLDDGTRILPLIFYKEYVADMSKLKAEYEQAVAVFLKDYPKHIDQAKRELGGLFKKDEYPNVNEIKTKFGFDVTIMPYPNTSDFRGDIDDEDLREMQINAEKKLQEQVKAILRDIGERLQEVVGHMADKLKEYKPGNSAKGIKASKTFRDSLVTNVEDLAQLISGLNMTGDTKIEAIRKRVVKELCAVKPDDLREDANARKRVMTSAQQILKDVSSFI